MVRDLLAGLLLFAVGLPVNSKAEIERHDYFVDSDSAIRLFVREVTALQLGATNMGKPILLLHGARVPGLASFDLPVPDGSLAADLARLDFDVYVMDVRGYGRSTRLREMDGPPAAHPPLVRSNQAVRDISAVVESIRQRRHVSQVAIFGWATGGQWAGYYASLYPEKVSALIP
jgi:pimeloyl-ACP methyl ester carboxylesterase